MQQETFMKILLAIFLRMFIATFLGLVAVVGLFFLTVTFLDSSSALAYVLLFLLAPLTPYIIAIRYIVGARKRYGFYFEIKNEHGEFIRGQNTMIRMFTIIAVILVAGFLSSVLFVTILIVSGGIQSARVKSNEAAIQSDLASIQTQAEIYYGGEGNNSYGTANPNNGCSAVGVPLSAISLFTDQTIELAVARADVANRSGTVECNSTPIAYAVSAQSAYDTNTYWCIDSTGTAKRQIEKLGSSTVCPPGEYILPEPSIISSLFEVVKGASLTVLELNWFLLSGEWMSELMKELNKPAP
jgi:hypothetical protein